MHYYKRLIGDYHRKAGRLSLLQHGVYAILMDAIYDREQFPTKEQAIDWTWASSQDELDAVDLILRKFFTLEDGVYVQKHIKEVLDKYQERCIKNKQIANEREQSKNESSTNRERIVAKAKPNHKPLTTNHKPLTKKDIFRDELHSLGLPGDLIFEWMGIRKKKKAVDSERAWSMFVSEVAKTDLSIQQVVELCCAEGWKGFKAEWVNKRQDQDFIKKHTDNEWRDGL